MNIKLFYAVSGSTTLGIFELDGSMRTSECNSPTRNRPLAFRFVLCYPGHHKCGPCRTAVAEHKGVSSVPAAGGLTSLEMEALRTSHNIFSRTGPFGENPVMDVHLAKPYTFG